VREGELERDSPAQRAAHHRRSLDPQLVEDLTRVLDMRERPAARMRRLAEAAQVDGDDRPLARQDRNLAAPHPPVGDALVDEQDRRPVAGHLVRDRHCSARIA
jgi:hypothetical protein